MIIELETARALRSPKTVNDVKKELSELKENIENIPGEINRNLRQIEAQAEAEAEADWLHAIAAPIVELELQAEQMCEEIDKIVKILDQVPMVLQESSRSMEGATKVIEATAQKRQPRYVMGFLSIILAGTIGGTIAGFGLAGFEKLNQNNVEQNILQLPALERSSVPVGSLK